MQHGECVTALASRSLYGEAGGALGLAWLDLSTGSFETQPVEAASLGAALARTQLCALPEEILEPKILQALKTELSTPT